MKTLLLMRHGKSDWQADFDHDHDRPLAKRGRRAADRMGRLLAQAGAAPDSAVTSTAVRASRTLERARAAGAWTCSVRHSEALYDATPGDVLVQVHAEPPETDVLMLVGHEPTWSMFTTACIGGGDVRMPTAAVARIDFDVAAWRQVAFGEGTLIWLLIPRLFEDVE